MKFNKEKWKKWYLPQKEFVDTVLDNIPNADKLNINTKINESFNPLKNTNDLIIILYLRLNLHEFIIYLEVQKLGFIRLNLPTVLSNYFPIK